MASTIINFQDLSSDKLLTGAARQTWEDKPVPALGGIPLIAKLGQGGMGAVYFGMHPRLKQEVAIKVLPFPLIAQQPQLVERFFREAQIAAKIKSNHLVGVTDVNEEGGLFYIVMEYVNGISAGAYLKEVHRSGCDGLPEAEALDICLAATEGLSAAHSENIVHRDVKPDNILIPRSKQGELLLKSAKLADLGLARGEDSNDSLTGTRTALGTPGFMAPEQCMDAKKAKMPADVFSMGATLFALLASRTPFKGDTPMETVLATLQKPPIPLRQIRPDVSAATEKLIYRCLEKEAMQRPANAAELLDALHSCRDALAISNIATAAAPTIATNIKATRVNSAPPASGYEATLVQSAGHSGAPQKQHGNELERTMLATPKPAIATATPPPAPAHELHSAPVQRTLSKPETASASKPVENRHAELFKNKEPQKSGGAGILAVAAVLAVAAGIAWWVWPHAQPEPTPEPAAVTPAVVEKAPAPKPPVTQTAEPPKPVVIPDEPKLPAPPVIKETKAPAVALTDDQKRQAVTDALVTAKKAEEAKDWTQVVAVLEAPVIQLGDLSHPARDEASALVLKARTEVAKRGIFLDKVKEAEALLAERKFDDAKALFAEAKALCPDSPNIKRAEKGIATVMAAVSEARYKAAMNDGATAFEAKNFADASRAYRRALEFKPGDSAATDKLRESEAKVSELAKAPVLPPKPLLPTPNHPPDQPQFPNQPQPMQPPQPPPGNGGPDQPPPPMDPPQPPKRPLPPRR